MPLAPTRAAYNTIGKFSKAFFLPVCIMPAQVKKGNWSSYAGDKYSRIWHGGFERTGSIRPKQASLKNGNPRL
ncbi:MAG: hypothetical protein Q7I93_03175, partial [Syntrophales bacterium]|nr:hypothetical protein [Syntrophales bacterium]